MNNIGLLQIMQSVDAFFPIGAFTLSNGLEDYVAEEWLQSPRDLDEYLDGFLHALPYQDLGLAHLAYTNAKDKAYIKELDDIAQAMKIPREVREGSSKMGKRFEKILFSLQQDDVMLEGLEGLTFPVLLGMYGQASGLEEKIFLSMFGYSLISAIVNNAVKLVPLSQLEGQKVLYGSLEKLDAAVEKALLVTIDDLGVSAPASDIHCMRHEKLYSRQYMS